MKGSCSVDRIVLNHDGVEAVLDSSGVQGDLMSRGSAIKATADSMDGCEYTLASRPGRKGGRHYVVVAANNILAIRKNNKHNTLLKALGSGGR